MLNSKVNAKGNAISNVDVSISLAKTMADLAGYSEAEIKAGTEFYLRKSRNTNPPGEFDRAGRFYAEERTDAVKSCRSPSRTYPWPEMHAARTAAHCAEVFGVPEEKLIAVRRFAKAVDRLIDGDRAPDAVDAAARLFKKGVKGPKAVAAINPVTVRKGGFGDVIFKGVPEGRAFELRAKSLGGHERTAGEWAFPIGIEKGVREMLRDRFDIPVAPPARIRLPYEKASRPNR